MKTPATTPWDSRNPTECGEYLVEFIGDWFPKGDINNVSHSIVHVVTDGHDSELFVLSEGRTFKFSEYGDRKWAKIINCENPSDPFLRTLPADYEKYAASPKFKKDQAVYNHKNKSIT